MNTSQKEAVSHGTPQFPFQIYDMQPQGGRLTTTCHWHNEVEIVLVHSGSFALGIEGAAYTAKEGDVYIINRGELHEMQGEDAPLHYSAFVFPLELLSFEVYDAAQNRYIRPLCAGKAHFTRHIAANVPCSAALRDVLHRVQQACMRQGVGYQLLVRSLLLQFAYCIIQAGLVVDADDAAWADEKQLLLREILQYLRENCHRKLTLREVAARFGFSAKYFCSFFKKQFGRGFVEYLNHMRLEKAASLLLEDTKIMAVGHAAGFENFSYFIRCFKARFGCTPAQYRKTLQSDALHSHVVHW